MSVLRRCTPSGRWWFPIRERLDRLHAEGHPRLADRLLAIGRDSAARLREPFRAAEHGDLLYDDRALPR